MNVYHNIKTVICCPLCHGNLVYHSDEISQYGTKTGRAFCTNCSKTVACINNHKVDFIRVTGECNVFDYEIIVQDEITRIDKQSGNLFPSRFIELIEQVPRDGLILDYGGGPRQLSDDRYINFEYSEYHEVDVYGDGHMLPFKDNSFDLVLSQAVTEHVYNPFQAAKEIFRVVKPGGRVYVESAFMQPLHGVPHHYFNTTQMGLEELFKNFEKINSGWFGNFSDLMSWMLHSTGIEAKVGNEKINTVMSIFKEFDEVATHHDIQPIAIGVYYEGIKT